jgi:hypothetical protein
VALINIERFRDVLVRTGVAEPVPALEELRGGVATNKEIQLTLAQFRADLERTLHRQTVQIISFMLGGLALAVAILGLIIALT